MGQVHINRLKAEKSPYLLQHQDNPIAWYAWGDEAFKAAREQNKPVFLSVGYSTCHWCHVMAHESFEDQEVADFLNAKFISIKVDREERPDVDELYMKAVQALTGGGGWPMSVWLTPEGKPFFAGTYFPKYRFLQLLRRIDQVWTAQREQLLEDGQKLLEVVRRFDQRESGGLDGEEMKDLLKSYANHFQYHFDDEYGGFSGAPKFPQTMNLMVMMRQDLKSGTFSAEPMVRKTLEGMIRGGIYDHLHGGLHRYSVDELWLVPHFEKMLYDQALLSVTLLEAHELYKDPEFARAAREILDYVRAELTHGSGGFYSAQDADSLNPDKGHAEEGFFATFSYDELKNSLSTDQLTALSRVYGVESGGQFEGRNILHLQEGFDRTAVETESGLREALAALKAMRASRPKPHLDDKIIAGWNGLMIWAFARAGLYLQEPRYTEAAENALTFARKKLLSGGVLRRFWRDGAAHAPATSEDYALLIHASLEVYQSTLKPEWAAWAQELQVIFDREFWDAKDSGYFTSDGRDPHLPLRGKDDHDGVTPASNSMAAYNLVRFYNFTGERKYLDRAEAIFSWLFPRLKRYPSSLPFLALAFDFHVSNPKVAVASGGEWVSLFHKEASSQFRPYLLWAGGGSAWPVTQDKTSGSPTIYVCEQGRCLKPAQKPVEAWEQIKR